MATTAATHPGILPTNVLHLRKGNLFVRNGQVVTFRSAVASFGEVTVTYTRDEDPAGVSRTFTTPPIGARVDRVLIPTTH